VSAGALCLHYCDARKSHLASSKCKKPLGRPGLQTKILATALCLKLFFADGVSECVLVVVSPLKSQSLMAFHREVYIRPDSVFGLLMMLLMYLVICLCRCLLFWNCIYVTSWWRDTSWWRGTVVERQSLAGELSLSCARPAADG